MPYAPPIFKLATKRRRGPDTRTSEERGDNFYGNKRWRDLRRMYLARNPLCVQCHAEGRTTPAREVDHIVPRRVDPSLQYAWSNLRGLCKPHHSRKTRRDTLRGTE